MWLVVIWSDNMTAATSHHQPNPHHIKNLRGISEVDFTRWKDSKPVQPKSDFRVYPDVTLLSYQELLTFTAVGCRAGFLGQTLNVHCDAVVNPGIYDSTSVPDYLLDWTLPRPKLIDILSEALLPNSTNHGKLDIEDIHLFYYLRYYGHPGNTNIISRHVTTSSHPSASAPPLRLRVLHSEWNVQQYGPRREAWLRAVVPFYRDGGKQQVFQLRLRALYNNPSHKNFSLTERQQLAIKIATDMGWRGPDGTPYTPESLRMQHEALFPAMAAANNDALQMMQALHEGYAASLTLLTASQPAGGGDDQVVEAEPQARKRGGRKGGRVTAVEVTAPGRWEGRLAEKGGWSPHCRNLLPLRSFCLWGH